MASVNLSAIQTNFKRYDIDGSGGLDRAELAKASLNAMGQEDSDTQVLGQMLATMVIGGKDQLGLFPDDNGDDEIQFAEFQKLAAASGNATSIESSDFETKFPDNYNPDGSSITTDSMDQLQQIAEGNLSKFSPDPESPEIFANSIQSLLGGKQDIGSMLQAIISLLSGR